MTKLKESKRLPKQGPANQPFISVYPDRIELSGSIKFDWFSIKAIAPIFSFLVKCGKPAALWVLSPVALASLIFQGIGGTAVTEALCPQHIHQTVPHIAEDVSPQAEGMHR